MNRSVFKINKWSTLIMIYTCVLSHVFTWNLEFCNPRQKTRKRLSEKPTVAFTNITYLCQACRSL